MRTEDRQSNISTAGDDELDVTMDPTERIENNEDDTTDIEEETRRKWRRTGRIITEDGDVDRSNSSTPSTTSTTALVEERGTKRNRESEATEQNATQQKKPRRQSDTGRSFGYNDVNMVRRWGPHSFYELQN